MLDVPFTELTVECSDSIAPELITNIVIEFGNSESFERQEESQPMIYSLCKDVPHRKQNDKVKEESATKIVVGDRW